MSNFRDAQNKAHPNKSATLMLVVITLLILIVGIQVWLLYTGLNNALLHQTDLALPLFIVSLLLFLAAAGLLYYLPGRR